MTDVNVRKITRDDVRVLAEMTAEIQQIHHQAAPDIFAEVTGNLSEFEAHIVSYMERGTGCIAEVNGQLLGCVLYEIRETVKNPFLKPHLRLHVDQMGVRPGFRGRGIGRHLMKQVMSAAKEHNVNFITLNVFCFNDGAIRFYEKFGFACHGMTMRLLI